MQRSKLKNSVLIASILTLSSPLELVKTRLQTTHQLLTSGKIKQNYQSIRHCISTIAKKQGIRSLWKGNTIGIARFFPNETINFRTRQYLQKKIPNRFQTNILMAVLSGWTASILLYPIDTFRIALSNTTEKQVSSNKLFKGIIQKHGPGFFFKGFANALIGTALFRGSFNGIYDTSKTRANSLQSKALIAYLCSVTAGSICYPLDILRRRRIMSEQKESLFKFGQKIFQREGVKGFYKGAKLILPQSVTGAIILMLFDTTGIPLLESSASN